MFKVAWLGAVGMGTIPFVGIKSVVLPVNNWLPMSCKDNHAYQLATQLFWLSWLAQLVKYMELHGKALTV
jgi:hypothetical protein